MNDHELARAAQRGDPEAFGELMHRYQHPLYRLAYRFCGTAEDADDLCQECLLRAFREIHRFDARRPFLPWLMKLASQEALRLAKARGAARPGESGYLLLRDGEETAVPLEKDRVLMSLGRLMPEVRLPVILRFVVGLTFREIAECTGQRPQSVAFRVSRGTLVLRGALDREREAQDR